MSLKSVAVWSILTPALLLPPGSAPVPAPADVRLTVATIHAAALTTARAADDSTDAPYLLASIVGPGSTRSTAHLPATSHLVIHQDQALGPESFLNLSLQPGDSVRLLVSLLEADQAQLTPEAEAASAAAVALSQPPEAQGAGLAAALAPVIEQGAHWLGSVSLLLTNEGGTSYWRSFECVATCRVLKAPGTGPLGAQPAAGVVEFSGSGGTYHLQLQGATGS
jgi:hypothetical protein